MPASDLASSVSLAEKARMQQNWDWSLTLPRLHPLRVQMSKPLHPRPGAIKSKVTQQTRDRGGPTLRTLARGWELRALLPGA